MLKQTLAFAMLDTMTATVNFMIALAYCLIRQVFAPLTVNAFNQTLVFVIWIGLQTIAVNQFALVLMLKMLQYALVMVAVYQTIPAAAIQVIQATFRVAYQYALVLYQVHHQYALVMVHVKALIHAIVQVVGLVTLALHQFALVYQVQ